MPSVRRGASLLLPLVAVVEEGREQEGGRSSIEDGEFTIKLSLLRA